MFPPSDNDSLENSNDNLNGKGIPASLVDETRGQDGLVPFGGGLTSGGMPWGYGLPMRPEILSAKPDVSNLLHALRRRKWLAIFLGLVLGGSLGVVAWLMVPTKYESTAALLVHITVPKIWIGESEIDFETFKRNQAAMIKGSLVVNKALEDKGLQDNAILKKNVGDQANWLSENLAVDINNGELMRISLRSEDREDIPPIINAIVQSYMKEVVEKERTDKLNRLDNLNKKLSGYKSQLHDKDQQLYTVSQSIGSTDARTGKVRLQMEVDAMEALMHQRTEIQRQISDLMFKIEKAKLFKKAAENNNVPEEEIEMAISRDPQIQQMTAELTQLMREQREIEKVIKNKNDPSLVRIHDAINSLKQNIEEVKNADRQQLIEQYRKIGDSSSVSMQSFELERDLLIAQYNGTTKLVESKAEEVQKLEKFNGDADQLRADIDQLQSVIRDMGATVTRWTVELDAPERVRVLDAASPSIPVAPAKQYAVAGFAGAFGFGLALLGVTFFEFLSRRLNASHELVDGLGIRVMGDLPALRRRIGMRQRSRRAMHGLVAESINGIRATLIQNAKEDSSNVFLVTSAGEQEGKTTVASQLAASLARGGRKTLLIDADLRHPGANLVFGLPNDDGFSELLRGEVEIDDVIRPTPADNLWMVTAGRCCATAVTALGKEAVAQVLNQLEAQFDFIIIDTGPVLKVADALLLGPHIDGAILSVLRDVSRIHKVYEANERLKLAGVSVVGAVVNGIEDRGSFDRYHVEMSAA